MLQEIREFDGKAGLADAARPDERHDAVRAQRIGYPGERFMPADQLRHTRRQRLARP
jgi:hypothetical protein